MIICTWAGFPFLRLQFDYQAVENQVKSNTEKAVLPESNSTTKQTQNVKWQIGAW